jgi:hypothetical protein
LYTYYCIVLYDLACRRYSTEHSTWFIFARRGTVTFVRTSSARWGNNQLLTSSADPGFAALLKCRRRRLKISDREIECDTCYRQADPIVLTYHSQSSITIATMKVAACFSLVIASVAAFSQVRILLGVC